MLKQRVITAFVLLGGLLVGVFLLPALAWLLLVSLVGCGAAWEWGGLSGLHRWQRGAFSALLGAVCVLLGMYMGLDGAPPFHALALGASYLVGAAFWLLVGPIWLNQGWRIRHPLVAALVGLVVLVPGILALAHLRAAGPWALLGALAVVWIADIAAYFSGRTFGRHKLAPVISPGKTWEGAAGAATGVVIAGGATFIYLFPGEIPLTVLLSLAVFLVGLTAISIEGDLFESMLKRQAGVKDSGTILPGHGGILDRIDSLTSTLPFAGLLGLWLVH